MSDIERYLFSKAEKPGSDLKNLLNTYMQLHQLKKEQGQRMWERDIREREITSIEELRGAQAEAYRQPARTTTGRPDLIARGGWSPEYIGQVAGHYNMTPEAFGRFSTADQGKMIKSFGEYLVEAGKESKEMDRNRAEDMIGDIKMEMQALAKDMGTQWAKEGSQAEFDKLQKITAQMRNLLTRKRVDWKKFYELYDLGSGLTEPEEKKEEIPIPIGQTVAGQYNVVGTITPTQALQQYPANETITLPSGRIIIKVGENQYLQVTK